MGIKQVVIIIPTHNEADAIEGTLFAVFQATEQISGMNVSVLVFDSASTDNTQQIVAELQAKNKKLHLQIELNKSGLGSAYLQAMRYALNNLNADIVIEFDADLSHQPKYLAPMLAEMSRYDVVIGSRYVQGGEIPTNWGWHRKLLSKLGNVVARLLLTPKYKDFTSGFRATNKQTLAAALPEKFLSNQYAYKLELFWKLHKNKARILEYPITFVDRQEGVSKLPTNSVWDSLRVLFILRFMELKRFFKMCLVGVSGVIIQFIVYNILRQSLSPFNAAQYAVIAAIMNNFILNDRFTFKKMEQISRYQKLKAFVVFAGYSAFMVYMQSHWLQLGIKYFGTGKLKENLIILSGIGLGSILNYLTYSRVVWRESKLQQT